MKVNRYRYLYFAAVNVVIAGLTFFVWQFTVHLSGHELLARWTLLVSTVTAAFTGIWIYNSFDIRDDLIRLWLYSEFGRALAATDILLILAACSFSWIWFPVVLLWAGVGFVVVRAWTSWFKTRYAKLYYEVNPT